MDWIYYTKCGLREKILYNRFPYMRYENSVPEWRRWMFQWINLVKGPFGKAKCIRKLTFYVRPYHRHERNICGPWYFYLLRDVVGIFMVFFPLSCMIFHPVEVKLWWFITDVLKGRTYLENSHYCRWWYKGYGSNFLTKIPRKYLLDQTVGWKAVKLNHSELFFSVKILAWIKKKYFRLFYR